MTRLVELRRGTYRDSVTLMQVSRAVADEPGVKQALVAMATPLNLDLLRGMGFDEPPDATAADLVVAVEAADDDAVNRASARLTAALSAPAERGAGPAAAPPPATLGSAVRRLQASVALVSTPGEWAAVEAFDALAAGASVMVFSDNVPVEQEVRLKDEAARRGLLVMGPDCGTAVLRGVGLGFANVVQPGPVGLVAASGTGAQQVMALLDGAGVGVSHCLGVGGRDLSAAVGGRSTLQALDLLAADEDTEVIVVISKPAAPEVAERVRAHSATLGKPVVFALVGRGHPDLTAALAEVVAAVGVPWQEPPSWPARTSSGGGSGCIRGSYAGGTLCDEAMVIVTEARGPVRSNIPLDPSWSLGDDLAADGDVMIDFGDDRLTHGRPHPLIDSSLRIERLLADAADPQCGVLLLDVVLGHGTHPDPAAELTPAICRAREVAGAGGRGLAVVVALVGTRGDPQGLDRQASALADAGASVYLSNAAAARAAVDLAGPAR